MDETFPEITSVPPEASIANEFKRTLNSQGFAFQEAVARRIASVETVTEWDLWLPEFPVAVHEQDTKIDITLVNKDADTYIICECKRANPAISNWCFAKSRFPVRRTWLAHRAYCETLLDRGDGVIGVHVKELDPLADLFQIAVEARTHKTGDPAGKGKGQIEETAGQVCRGLNGLIEFFYKREMVKTQGKREIAFLPMIVTTAKLYVTDDDLSVASLTTGKVGQASLSVREVKWLWYQYHQSPALKHNARVNNPMMGIKDILFYEFVRTIAVVTPEGLGDFLTQRFWSPR